MINFLEGFRLAIVRDLAWQAAARKARDVGFNSNSTNSRMHVGSAPDAVSPETGAKEAPRHGHQNTNSRNPQN
jgi:hypothetical protein